MVIKEEIKGHEYIKQDIREFSIYGIFLFLVLVIVVVLAIYISVYLSGIIFAFILVFFSNSIKKAESKGKKVLESLMYISGSWFSVIYYFMYDKKYI